MGSKRILIVEDELLVAEDLREALKGMEYQVCGVVSSGEAALQLMADGPADLVLMDIRLEGDMDGVETAEHIRTQFDVPVIYLTAYTDRTTLERAKKTEPLGYVVKPFDERELRVSIEMALYKHAVDAQLKRSERWLDTLLRSISDAVIATDLRGIVAFVNPVAETLFGLSQEDHVGKTLECICPDLVAGLGIAEEDDILSVSEDRFGQMQELQFRLHDGQIIFIEYSIAAIRDEKENPTGFVWVGRNITERKEMQKQMLEMSDEEQERIGRDLHGALGQHLTGLAFLSQGLARQLSGRPPAEAEAAARIGELATEAALYTRELVRGLSLVALEGEGLVVTLQGFAAGIEDLFGISCFFAASPDVSIDDHAKTVHLFRITQEAVSNATTHSQAQNIWISLVHENDQILLRIRDDGVGISSTVNEQGTGLRTMAYRASVLGGSLEVKEGADGGTLVTCSIPNTV